MDNQNSTINDVLEAIGTFSNKTEERFDKLDSKVDGSEGRVVKIEANMVTKEYLDEKLSDLQADLSVLIRKEDHKLAVLVGVLKEKKVISEQDAKQILSMEPFPKSV